MRHTDKQLPTMNEARRIYLEEKEKFDNELFEKIKNNPHPPALDLWSLSEEKFIEWRRLNDFPNLLKLFNTKFRKFEEWKKANKLDDETLIKSGFLTPFLEKKKSIKDTDLYLTKQICDGEESLIVSYTKLEGKKTYLGRKYNFEFIQKFTSYLNWLETKKEFQNILFINSRVAPNTERERVYLHADVYARSGNYELLKMGGIDIPKDEDGILFRGKRLEFVNLCGLNFSGDILYGENGNLDCYYSVCDNWLAQEINFPNLNLTHCSILNFNLYNSKIEQWNIHNCHLSGDFYNSKLYHVKIVNGLFKPVLLDCTLSNTHIESIKFSKDSNIEGYKMLKKIYQNQGDDDLAQYYFIRENEFIRENSKGWNYFTKSLSYYYWEYGRKPHRIIYLSIAVILIFGFMFWLNNSLISNNIDKTLVPTLGDSFYFSTITFTTLGYGDLSPHGWLKFLCSMESFLGVINTGFLIAGYANNKY